VARLKINFVFHLKFPFTSSDLGFEYRLHLFNTFCIILKLFPRRTLKVRNVEQGSESSCEIWIHTRFQNIIYQGSEKWPLTCVLLLYFYISCLKNRWLAEKQMDKPLPSFEWSTYAEISSNSLQLPTYASYCHFSSDFKYSLDEVGGKCGGHSEYDNSVVVVGKSRGKKLRRRHRRRWANTFAKDIKAIRWEEVEWVQVDVVRRNGGLLRAQQWNVGLPLGLIVIYVSKNPNVSDTPTNNR